MYKFAKTITIFLASLICSELNASELSYTKIDSITIDLNSLLNESEYTIQLVVKNNECFCLSKRYQFSPSNNINSLLDFENDKLSHSQLYQYNYHQINSLLSSCLLTLIDSLFITRNCHIIDYYCTTKDLIYSFEPTTSISVKIYKKSDNFNIVETFNDEQEFNCTYNGIRRHSTDYRHYSTTYRSFVILLHYIGICEGLNFSDSSEIKEYINNYFPNLNVITIEQQTELQHVRQ